MSYDIGFLSKNNLEHDLDKSDVDEKSKVRYCDRPQMAEVEMKEEAVKWRLETKL